MSLHRFFEVKTAEKRKLGALGAVEHSPNKCKNKLYDDQKRQRRYQVKWTEMWFWVEYNDNEGLMYCKACKKYPSIARSGKKNNAFVEGTDNFRIDALRSHDDSTVHKESVSHYRQDKEASAFIPPATVVATDPIQQAFRKIDTATRDRLRTLFTVAYTIAKNGRPLDDMTFQCSMLNKIGVDIGSNYDNPKAARGFTSAISATIRTTEVENIQKCNFVSVLADGSTDCRVTEQETVYVRYVADGQPKTVFANVVAVEHAHSQGVYDAVVKGLGTLKLNVDDITSTKSTGPKLVSVNFDGAAVMMGKKTGVATKFTDIAPHVIPMHCVAHKLELAVLDAVKRVKYLGKFEDTIKGLFKFYHYSPKMRREITEISRILDEDLVHFSSVKQVRWLSSKTRAISAIKQNLQALILHMESASTGKSDNSAKAKGYLKEITSQSFIRALHIMLDIMPILSNASKVFQTQDLLVLDVTAEIENMLLQLNSIKLDPSLGKNISNYVDQLNATDKKFGEITINGKCEHENTRIKRNPLYL